MAPLVRREVATLPGGRVTDVGNDGRSDILLCEVAPGHHGELLRLRTVEDVFVEVGRTLRSEGDHPAWIARRILRAGRLAAGLATWRRHHQPPRAGRDDRAERGERAGRDDQRGPTTRAGLAHRWGNERSGPRPATYRSVVRVLQERRWQRTDLRRALDDTLAVMGPGWRRHDPAAVEVWASEYARGRFVAGIRLTTAETRSHGGRAVERLGALRPTVAAGMVTLAAPAGHGAGRRLVDPCCGSGTILAEGRAAGWVVHGRDIDPAAVSTSRRNVPGTEVMVGDVRALDLPDVSVDACVSNLPFGRRYTVQGDPSAWLATTLTELARVTRIGGRVVLLAPDIPVHTVPSQFRLRERHRLRLLGLTTTLWAYDRR
jgi:hypothetical protein